MTRNSTTWMVALALSAMGSLALAEEPKSGTSCVRKAGAPDWVPCGEDRVLSAEDLSTYLLKPEKTARLRIAGVSGTKYFLNFLANGKMEAGRDGGPNIGNTWNREGNRVCRNYARFFNGPQCGTFELKDGVLHLVDADASVNPVTDLSFSEN